MAFHPVEENGDFSIHEVVKALHITRTIVLNYEKLGLLSPTKVESSGYRYYSPEAFAKLMWIERLKKSGLSLPEIKAFMAGELASEEKISDLEEKRDTIDGLIKTLKIDLVNRGIYSVEEESNVYCSVLECPFSFDLKDNYLNARYNIARNIEAGSIFNPNRTYFAYFPSYFKNGSINKKQPKIYRQCMPILKASKKMNPKTIHLKKLFRCRLSVQPPVDRSVLIEKMLIEAKKRHYKANGGLLFVSETNAVAREDKTFPYIVSIMTEIY